LCACAGGAIARVDETRAMSVIIGRICRIMGAGPRVIREEVNDEERGRMVIGKSMGKWLVHGMESFRRCLRLRFSIGFEGAVANVGRRGSVARSGRLARPGGEGRPRQPEPPTQRDGPSPR